MAKQEILRMLSHPSTAATVVIVSLMALVSLPHVCNAQAKKKPVAAGGLEGSWSGGGTVTFASGSRERASCRARYSRAGTNTYTVNATCATASGRAAQVASVRQVGENRYSGSFYNSEYGISGVMHVVVRGTSQTVRLISDSASAVVNLSR
jgi:hypothetical protein